MGLSHSSETDSDAAAKIVTPHWRLRKRSGIVSKRHENVTENNSKDNEEFKLPPLPSKEGAKGNRRYMRNSAPVKERSGNCNPTDSLLGNLQSSRPSLVNYSSSSSLDILNVCDPDQALLPSWNIVDSLTTEADKANKALPPGGVVEDVNSCGPEKNTEKSQIRTWPLLDDLYSYSNENVSSLINVGCSQNDVHCSDEEDYPGLNPARCACNKCKPSTWDFWDLPPSESTLIDIAIDADCHSEVSNLMQPFLKLISAYLLHTSATVVFLFSFYCPQVFFLFFFTCCQKCFCFVFYYCTEVQKLFCSLFSYSPRFFLTCFLSCVIRPKQ